LEGGDGPREPDQPGGYSRKLTGRSDRFAPRGARGSIPGFAPALLCANVTTLALPILALAVWQSPLPADSVRVLDAAREAQARYERDRRWSLPVSFGIGGNCQVRVGRYCYWYDEGEPAPPAEPRIIGIGRERLLQELSSAAIVIPGDDWIAGQRVRYLIEAGDSLGAATVAQACRGSRWWCAALTGFVEHVTGRYPAADSVFAIALQEMGEERRCQWNDIQLLLSSDVHKNYKKLSCAERDSANARLTWLARPRLSDGGNPALTEILARRTHAAMLERSATHHSISFGDDFEEIILRYGWATAFSRQAREVTATSPPTVIGHEPKPAYAFLPEELSGDTGAVWSIAKSDARSRFHTPWTPAVRWIDDIQWARFRRGDRSLMVATFVVPWDTLGVGERVRARLMLSRGPSDDAPVSVTVETSSREGALLAPTGAGDTFLAGIEVTDRVTGAVALGRSLVQALPDPSQGIGPQVSDILLFRPGEELPGSLPAAVNRAHYGMRVEEQGRVGLYWEVYGLTETDSVEVSLAVEEERAGFLKRLGRSLGVVGRPAPVQLSWEAGEGGAGTRAQVIELDLAPLAPGRYRILLRMAGPGIERLETTRAIEIVSR